MVTKVLNQDNFRVKKYLDEILSYCWLSFFLSFQFLVKSIYIILNWNLILTKSINKLFLIEIKKFCFFFTTKNVTRFNWSNNRQIIK